VCTIYSTLYIIVHRIYMKFGPVYSSLNLIKNNLILKYVYNIIMLKTWRRWGYT